MQSKLRISATTETQFAYFYDLLFRKLAMVPFPSIPRNHIFGIDVIFSLCNPFKIFRDIIGFVEVLMVHLMVWGWRKAYKSCSDEPMDKAGFMNPILTQVHLSVASDIPGAEYPSAPIKAFDAAFIRYSIKTFISDYIAPFFHRDLLFRGSNYNLLIIDTQ